MDILHSGIDWLGSHMALHPVMWLAGTFLAGVVIGIVFIKRSKKKKD